MTLLANAVIMGGRAVQGDLSGSFGSNEYFLFSIFRHIPTYTGYSLRVERLSDSTTLDVGFDASGLLNTSEIETFCSGTTGRVIRFYDQSENTPGSYNGYVSRSYATAPIIYESGAVIIHTTTGLPCFKTDLSNSEFLTATFATTSITATTHFGVVEGVSGQYNIGLATTAASQRYSNIGKTSSGQLRLITRKSSATSNILQDYATGETAESIIGGKIESDEMVGADNGSIISTDTGIGTDVFGSADTIEIARLNASPNIFASIELSFACIIIGELSNSEITDFQDVVNEAYELY